MKVGNLNCLLNLLFTIFSFSECDDNCNVCTTNGLDKCDQDQCKTGYFYDSTDHKCYEAKSNCLTSGRSNGNIICLTCDTTKYVFANNDCLKCPNGCKGCLYDTTNKKITCSTCNEGYYLKNNECPNCPQGCKTCVTVGDSVECLTCNPKYGLKDKTCQSCGAEYCQTCEPSTDGKSLICKVCLENFYVNSNKCGNCPVFCKECSYTNNKYLCNKCLDKYALTSDKTSCVRCPSNCKLCQQSSNGITTCLECESDAYFLDSDGLCKSCDQVTIPNCKTCQKSDENGKAECKSCNEGLTLQDDKTACLPCSIESCTSCLHGRQCSKCKTGTYLFNFDRECASEFFFVFIELFLL